MRRRSDVRVQGSRSHRGSSPSARTLLIFGSFASDGYQLACRMLVALAKAVAFATADSMIPTSTDVARLIVS